MRKLSCIVGAEKKSENTNPKCLQFAAKIKGSPFQYFWNVYVCIGKVSESNVTPPPPPTFIVCVRMAFIMFCLACLVTVSKGAR